MYTYVYMCTRVHTGTRMHSSWMWSTVSREACAQRQEVLRTHTACSGPIRPGWVLSLSRASSRVLRRHGDGESRGPEPRGQPFPGAAAGVETAGRAPAGSCLQRSPDPPQGPSPIALGEQVRVWMQHPQGEQATCPLCPVPKATSPLVNLPAPAQTVSAHPHPSCPGPAEVSRDDRAARQESRVGSRRQLAACRSAACPAPLPGWRLAPAADSSAELR